MRIVVASTPLPADLEARSRYRAFLFEMSDLIIDGKMPLLGFRIAVVLNPVKNI
jgi:hypothetical protein